MDSRLKLHERLVEILGSEYVYFQPPESIKMHYPCIRYELSGYKDIKADNKVFVSVPLYTLTVITREADDDIHIRLKDAFMYINYDRPYVSDNLYHHVFELYFK